MACVALWSELQNHESIEVFTGTLHFFDVLYPKIWRIFQVMVEDQPDFPTVLKLFNEWLVKENLLPCENAEKPESKTQTSAQTDDGIPQAKFAFVTCGDWDLKKMLPAQLKQHNLPIDSHFKSWINIKKSFHTKIGTFPRGMMVMLASLDIGRIFVSVVIRVDPARRRMQFLQLYHWAVSNTHTANVSFVIFGCNTA